MDILMLIHVRTWFPWSGQAYICNMLLLEKRVKRMVWRSSLFSIAQLKGGTDSMYYITYSNVLYEDDVILHLFASSATNAQI